MQVIGPGGLSPAFNHMAQNRTPAHPYPDAASRRFWHEALRTGQGSDTLAVIWQTLMQAGDGPSDLTEDPATDEGGDALSDDESDDGS